MQSRPGTEERLLAEGPCAVRIGPMNFSGHVVLTTRRVVFQPTPFSRRIGVEPWSIEIASIRSAHLVGAEGALSICGAERQPSLVGLGARIVHERLAPLLTDAEEVTYAAGERVLLHAAATVELNDLLHAVGEVTVTTRRIRFRPNQMDRMLWPRIPFEHQNDQITSFELSGIRPGIEVRTATHQARFVGDVLPALYAALQYNAELRAGPADAANHDVAVWPGVLLRGPVTHPGGLLHTSTRLAFVATGLLDSLAGAQSLTEVSLPAITSLVLRGQLDRRLDVHATSVGMTVACDDLDECFDRLVTWLANGAPGPVWLGDGAPTAVLGEIEDVLGPWRSQVRLPAVPRRFTPAVCLTGSLIATPGLLVVTEHDLIWLPGRTPGAGSSPLVLPLARARFVWDDDPDEVRVDVEGAPHRWVTRTQRQFRSALFTDVQRARGGVVLPPSPDAEAGNRRDSFRVEVLDQRQPPISIFLDVDGMLRPLDLRIADLSLGGCGLRLAHPVEVGSLIRVELTEGAHMHPARGRVVKLRANPPGPGWFGGVVFEESSPGFDDALRKLWMALQREQLQRQTGERLTQGHMPRGRFGAWKHLTRCAPCMSAWKRSPTCMSRRARR